MFQRFKVVELPKKAVFILVVILHYCFALEFPSSDKILKHRKKYIVAGWIFPLNSRWLASSHAVNSTRK